MLRSYNIVKYINTLWRHNILSSMACCPGCLESSDQSLVKHEGSIHIELKCFVTPKKPLCLYPTYRGGGSWDFLWVQPVLWTPPHPTDVSHQISFGNHVFKTFFLPQGAPLLSGVFISINPCRFSIMCMKLIWINTCKRRQFLHYIPSRVTKKQIQIYDYTVKSNYIN